MSTWKFQEEGAVTKASINGPRPSPLRIINKESHAIQKPSSSAVEKSFHRTVLKNQNSPAKRQPVIIYTHSPKIIHAQACDFMALVQKLTGFTPSSEELDDKKPEPIGENKNKGFVKNVEYEDVDNDSSLTTAEAPMDSNISAVSELFGVQVTATDVPLFTPNTHLFQSPTFDHILQSPSLMDFMKGFGDY